MAEIRQTLVPKFSVPEFGERLMYGSDQMC